MPSPDNIRNGLRPIHRILQPQFLPHSKSLRHNRQASRRADIHRVPNHRMRLTLFRPLQLNLYAGIQAHSRPHILGPRPFARFLHHAHGRLLNIPLLRGSLFATPRPNCFRATGHGFLRISPRYVLPPPPSMGLPLHYPRPVTLWSAAACLPRASKGRRFTVATTRTTPHQVIPTGATRRFFFARFSRAESRTPPHQVIPTGVLRSLRHAVEGSWQHRTVTPAAVKSPNAPRALLWSAAASLPRASKGRCFTVATTRTIPHQVIPTEVPRSLRHAVEGSWQQSTDHRPL
jgi:hypothetical protein